MSELYNEQVKENFLQDAYGDSEGSQHNIRYLFKKIAKYEKNRDKDISEFTRDEIRNVLESTRPFSLSDVKRKGNYINFYIQWMIENGHRSNNISPLLAADDNFYMSTLDTNRKLYFSLEEFEDILENVPNAQDQAMLSLMFYGIVGEEFKELTHLTYYDIDWNTGVITVRNREDKFTGESFDVERQVNDRTLYFLERAHKQPYFYTNNETNDRPKTLIETDLILKNVVSSRVNKGAAVSPSTLYGRLTRLKEHLELEYLTSKTVMQSGMLYMAYDLIFNQKKHKDLSTELYQEIGAYYNYSVMRQANGDSYYNRNFMAKFINPENMKALYDVEVSESRARS
ncbi:phage lytic cycle repressor MrpR family protein [Niallia taxi]|uniref:phage lytic cycle repressor MrpR family protein n=1 Tax=Niallia taxi TaxID=2499688 RepID=UPI0030090B67